MTRPPLDEHCTLWEGSYDLETSTYSAKILLAGLDQSPISFSPGARSREELVSQIQATYGTDAQYVVPDRFEREQRRRITHRSLLLSRLSAYHTLSGEDLTFYVVYGSPFRPLSGAELGRLSEHGAISLFAEKSQDGYYSYIAVPQFLPDDVEEAYELECVSRPLVLKQQEEQEAPCET